MNLTKNFTLEEMVVSQTASRKGIYNVPDKDAVKSLEQLCRKVLEPLRGSLNKSVLVTSGYRSVELNKEIGGSPTSEHCFGRASDIHVPGMTIESLYQYIKKSKLPFNQLIQEFDSWVHVSLNIDSNKRQCLRATRTNDGKVIYTEDK